MRRWKTYDLLRGNNTIAKGDFAMLHSNRTCEQMREEYSRLNTDELRELLRRDFSLPDNESNVDAVICIMEILSERDESSGNPSFTEAETAWKNFKNKYLEG